MAFGLIHRVATGLLALLGVLAVVSAGAIGSVASTISVVGTLLAVCVPESWQPRPWAKHVPTITLLVLLVTQSARLMLGSPAVEITVEFATLLQVIRVATRRGAAHDQQIIVLALLHLIAGTVLGGSLSFGLCFLAFLIVAPGAMVLSHLRREVEGNYRQGARDRTGLPVDVPRILRSRRVVGRGFLAMTCLLAFPILAFTAVLFLLFPRVSLSWLLVDRPRGGRMIGFSDHVDLGSVGVLRSDPTIALRFTLATSDPPPPRMILRLRGTAFDSYDGRAWSRTEVATAPALQAARPPHASIIRRPPNESDQRIAIDLEPIDPPVVFLPPAVVALTFTAPKKVMGQPVSLQRGSEGEFRYAGNGGGGAQYDVFVDATGAAQSTLLPARERERDLEVPRALPDRVRALAHQWADPEATPWLKAKAIESHLRGDYAYDLASPSGGAPEPLDHFLFESRRGHCEFFSTAMAMMLREVGIPSRNVTGFIGGTYNRFGHYYAVRQGDAHSWVEAYLDAERPYWATFDPTPSSGAQPHQDTTGAWVYLRDAAEALSQRWNQSIVGYDLTTQAGFADSTAKRYDKTRKALGLDRGALGRMTRGPVVATALVVVAFGAYALWRRRRRRDRLSGPRHSAMTPRREEAKILVLFQRLESCLQRKGIAREPSIPPLRHALALQRANHPLATELLALTQIYLGVRFGREPLDEALAADYQLRIVRIRDSV